MEITVMQHMMKDNYQGIASFFKGKTIFVTGGTGFVGKVLIEKLLRSCPQLVRIYVLIRPKKGLAPPKRLQDLLSTKIFDRVRRTDFTRKVICLSGDVSLPRLGLKDEDLEHIYNEVNVVFHSAATVKFDEPLCKAVALNVTSTRSLLQICHKIKGLQALVHVSTTFAYCDRREAAEHIYSPPADPDRIINLATSLTEDLQDAITPLILGNRPNTYTFTKALAESLIQNERGQLPVAIVRPSIVTGAWNEPLPGFVDNLNGATGLIAGAGKGVLRSILCPRKNVGDVIPVDLVANLMIAIAWHTAVNKPSSLMVYNCSSGTSNPITWGKIKDEGYQCILKYPFKEVIWYPGGTFHSSVWANNIFNALMLTLPAYVGDMVLFLIGRKTELVKLQQRLKKAIKTLEFFTKNEFVFPNLNTQNLYKQLHPEDQKTFNFDISQLNWEKYIDVYVLGTREYVMKEDPKTIPEARVNLRRAYCYHIIAQGVLLLVAWKLLMSGKGVWKYLLVLLSRYYGTTLRSLGERLKTIKFNQSSELRRFLKS